MIGIYCRRHHHSVAMCAECAELLQYACVRTDRCPVGADKKSCARCAIHCYDAAHRQRIRTVMRYVGPRLLFIHPVMAIRHLIKERL